MKGEKAKPYIRKFYNSNLDDQELKEQINLMSDDEFEAITKLLDKSKLNRTEIKKSFVSYFSKKKKAVQWIGLSQEDFIKIYKKNFDLNKLDQYIKKLELDEETKRKIVDGVHTYRIMKTILRQCKEDKAIRDKLQNEEVYIYENKYTFNLIKEFYLKNVKDIEAKESEDYVNALLQWLIEEKKKTTLYVESAKKMENENNEAKIAIENHQLIEKEINILEKKLNALKEELTKIPKETKKSNIQKEISRINKRIMEISSKVTYLTYIAQSKYSTGKEKYVRENM